MFCKQKFALLRDLYIVKIEEKKLLKMYLFLYNF